MIRGRAVFASVVAAFVAMIGGAIVTIDTVRYRADDRRADCERIVQARDDVRAMWLTTFDLFPDSDTVTYLREVLDDRLPPMFCDTDIPVPIPQETTE